MVVQRGERKGGKGGEDTMDMEAEMEIEMDMERVGNARKPTTARIEGDEESQQRGM